MVDWIPAAVLVAIIGTVGTIYGIRSTRKTALETTKVNESDLIIRSLSEQVKTLTDRQDKSDVKLNAAYSEITDMRSQIRRLSDSEWSLRRYVTVLMDFIRSHNLDPPDPPDYSL